MDAFMQLGDRRQPTADRREELSSWVLLEPFGTNHGVDSRVTQCAIGITRITAENAFERKIQAFGDAPTPAVAVIHTNLDSFGMQGLERESRNSSSRFGDISFPFKSLAHPIPDFKARHVPIETMQTATADKFTRIFF